MQVELNGVAIDREDIRSWLLSKKCTLWSDWCISDPKRMEIAIDWFAGEMDSLAASKAPAPKPVNGKKVKKNARRRTAASTS